MTHCFCGINRAVGSSEVIHWEVISVSIPVSCPEVLYPPEATGKGRIQDRGTGHSDGYRHNWCMILSSYTYGEYSYVDLVRL